MTNPRRTMLPTNTGPYSHWDDAVLHEIIRPIEASSEVTDARAAFDIDAIAAQVLSGYDQGYQLTVSQDQFWQIVQDNAQPPA